MSSTQQLLLAEGGGGAAPNYIEDVFSTYLYTGTNANQTITNNIDLSTKGGLVWVKSRSNAYNHFFMDTARGAESELSSNNTDPANTATTGYDLTSFNTNGFSLGPADKTGINTASSTQVSWTFRKQPKFFDIVTYTGNGTAGRQISHSLGSTPGFMIIKRTDATSDWPCWHRSLSATSYITLDQTNQSFVDSTVFNAAPTSTYFQVGADAWVNASGGTYVAYIFAHDAGGFGLTGTDNVISCGTYTGNGAATGPTVTLGYEPQWVLIKQSSGAGQEWAMLDSMRGLVAGSGGDSQLFANTSDAETTGNTYVAPTATGFNLETGISRYNASGATYIYIAIRRGPMKVPTDGTTVFNTDVGRTAASGATPAFISNFVTDLGFVADRSSAGNKEVASRLTGPTRLRTNTTDAEAAQSAYTFDYMTGWNSAGSAASTQLSWMFKRAPSFFDEVCYTGTDAARTISHNLQAVPEMIIVKRRNSLTIWAVYHSGIGNTQAMELNSSDSVKTSVDFWNSTTPTSSVFSIGGSNTAVNAGSSPYVAYLFATCAGVSKVGSYTGNGSTQAIACGFTGGARFVLIKRTNSTGDWYVYDTARGMTVLTDPYLLLNSTAAESATLGSVTTTTGGFTVDASILAAINTNAASYIFLAIA